MNWYCCDRCQKWHDCDTKWFRGEKHIPQYCCPNCNNYGECYEKFKNDDAAKAMKDDREKKAKKKK
ncbi:MAG TPA: hypothetical protein PKW98_14265 [Candidatus Wallbacteria bacterium]|nr:MAG: hypothetical protein BWY32_02239 [bacterium ADurb.Bin243]HPG58980.1 hypothetical protein [Candidatus Wallbacteria bacterium]